MSADIRPTLFTVVFSSMLISACQQVPVQDESSSRSRIAVGSQLLLNQPLTVPAGHARVFLQHGKVRAKTRLRRFEPHCNFETEQVSDGRLVIAADSFVVTARVEDEVEIVHRRSPLRPAAFRLSGEADIPPQLNRVIHHRLHSARQPWVMRLSCYGGFADPFDVVAPSVHDIREALGELVTLAPTTAYR